MTCLHETLAFASGEYYIVCRSCGKKWGLVRRGQPEYTTIKGIPFGTSPSTSDPSFHDIEPRIRIVQDPDTVYRLESICDTLESAHGAFPINFVELSSMIRKIISYIKPSI